MGREAWTPQLPPSSLEILLPQWLLCRYQPCPPFWCPCFYVYMHRGLHTAPRLTLSQSLYSPVQNLPELSQTAQELTRPCPVCLPCVLFGFSALDAPGPLPPQALCTCRSLFPKHLLRSSLMTPSITSLGTLLKSTFSVRPILTPTI